MVIAPQAQVFIAAFQHQNQTSTVQNNLFCIISEFMIERKEEFGGNKIYKNFEEVEQDFASEV